MRLRRFAGKQSCKNAAAAVKQLLESWRLWLAGGGRGCASAAAAAAAVGVMCALTRIGRSGNSCRHSSSQCVPLLPLWQGGPGMCLAWQPAPRCSHPSGHPRWPAHAARTSKLQLQQSCAQVSESHALTLLLTVSMYMSTCNAWLSRQAADGVLTCRCRGYMSAGKPVMMVRYTYLFF